MPKSWPQRLILFTITSCYNNVPKKFLFELLKASVMAFTTSYLKEHQRRLDTL